MKQVVVKVTFLKVNQNPEAPTAPVKIGDLYVVHDPDRCEVGTRIHIGGTIETSDGVVGTWEGTGTVVFID